MTLLDILVKGAAAAAGLKSYLMELAAKYPDAAPKLNEYIALLDGAVAQDNLVALATALPGEIADIAAGRINPRRHPSSAA